MTSGSRALSVGILALLLGAALFAWRPASSAVLYSGIARADDGPLSLEVTVSPPVGLPGTVMQLNARLTNSGIEPLTPSVSIRLPRGITADMYALPPGATFNLQANHVDWLPVVPAAGATEFTVDLAVESVDVTSPEQSVTALMRHRGQEKELDAPLWIGIPPLVGEVLARGQVAVGQPIQLHADIAGPGPFSTVWDLGDGRRLELDAPEVVFPTAGQQDIYVEVSNPGGRITRHFSLLVLPNPVAVFQPDDDHPATGQPITFLNTSGGQPPLKVFWDFGDGSTVMGEQQPVHAYRSPGLYRVRLTVENDFGRSEAVWDVTVGVGPVVDMVIPDRTAVGQAVNGQAFGDDSVERYIWDMGDGRSREGSLVSHIYRFPGDYYVTMTADNGYEQVQVGRWIRVNDGITSLFLPMAAHFDGTAPAVIAADLAAPIDLDPAVGALADTFVLAPLTFAPGTSPAEQLLAYINAARSMFGLSALPYNFELSAAAQSHAVDKARFPDNPHVGTDSTSAAERLLRSGYRGGYAGEATAWGFSDPREAVEFWVNSDSHRPLILNQLGTEIGIGYMEDMSSANVWHWTAEFGIAYGAPVQPVLRSLLPAMGYGALNSDVTSYHWMWPLPLASGERFTVFLANGQDLIPLGSVNQPVYGSRYVLSTDALRIGSATAGGIGSTTSGAPANYEWLVRLEDGRGGVIAESERRSISITLDPVSIAPTPVPTLPIVTVTPFMPTPTPTPTVLPTAEPPSNEPPPVIVTVTPQPTQTP